MQLLQTTPLYSRTGLINDMYKRSKDFPSNLNLNALNRLTRCHSLVVISTIWLCQVRSEEKVIPKCLWCSTSCNILLSIIRSGWFSFIRFLETTIVSVFTGLKSTSHWLDHAWTVERLEIIMSAAARGFFTIMYKLVSSANSLMLQFNSQTISLM